jgi:[acyl-carrier-protein] S-malonyltransferase
VTAFVFPGSGSQIPAMGRAWIDHPSWSLVEHGSAITGRDLHRLLLETNETDLRVTRNTHLAIFIMSLVVADAVRTSGLEATAYAGHSSGEYAALVASGALSFEDGMQLVSERGDAMQAACDERPGTMTAVLGLDDDGLDAACSRAEGDAWVANYNAPGHAVIAGSEDALARAGRAAVQLGARRLVPLRVGGAFHTEYMTPARERLRKALAHATFNDTDLPVFANVDARPHNAGDEWPDLLSAQLCSPVRWRQTMVRLIASQTTTFIELGPGHVLSNFVKRTARELQSLHINKPSDIDRVVSLAHQRRPTPDYGDPFGERLSVSWRLIVSPTIGRFVPRSSRVVTAQGELVAKGDVIGTVAGESVRSPFSGWLIELLARPGDRVKPGEPLALLHPI